MAIFAQANPKLAFLKDEDERLPIHWAVAYNRLPIVELLIPMKNFDPDVTVCDLAFALSRTQQLTAGPGSS